MIMNLEKQLKVIETGLASDPNELNLLRNQMEVENKLELARFELNDVVEVKTTAEESMAFSNSWRTYRERTDRLVCSRGKVYSLVLGQCTTVLLDKMKQDSNWQTVRIAVQGADGLLVAVLDKAQFWQRWAGTPMNARQTLVLNRVLDGMEGKLTNAKWAAIGKCSADTALRDINDLLARGVLARLEGGGRNTAYILVK